MESCKKKDCDKDKNKCSKIYVLRGPPGPPGTGGDSNFNRNLTYYVDEKFGDDNTATAESGTLVFRTLDVAMDRINEEITDGNNIRFDVIVSPGIYQFSRRIATNTNGEGGKINIKGGGMEQTLINFDLEQQPHEQNNVRLDFSQCRLSTEPNVEMFAFNSINRLNIQQCIINIPIVTHGHTTISDCQIDINRAHRTSNVLRGMLFGDISIPDSQSTSIINYKYIISDCQFVNFEEFINEFNYFWRYFYAAKMSNITIENFEYRREVAQEELGYVFSKCLVENGFFSGFNINRLFRIGSETSFNSCIFSYINMIRRVHTTFTEFHYAFMTCIFKSSEMYSVVLSEGDLLNVNSIVSFTNGSQLFESCNINNLTCNSIYVSSTSGTTINTNIDLDVATTGYQEFSKVYPIISSSSTIIMNSLFNSINLETNISFTFVTSTTGIIIPERPNTPTRGQFHQGAIFQGSTLHSCKFRNVRTSTGITIQMPENFQLAGRFTLVDGQTFSFRTIIDYCFFDRIITGSGAILPTNTSIFVEHGNGGDVFVDELLVVNNRTTYFPVYHTHIGVETGNPSNNEGQRISGRGGNLFVNVNSKDVSIESSILGGYTTNNVLPGNFVANNAQLFSRLVPTGYTETQIDTIKSDNVRFMSFAFYQSKDHFDGTNIPDLLSFSKSNPAHNNQYILDTITNNNTGQFLIDPSAIIRRLTIGGIDNLTTVTPSGNQPPNSSRIGGPQTIYINAANTYLSLIHNSDSVNNSVSGIYVFNYLLESYLNLEPIGTIVPNTRSTVVHQNAIPMNNSTFNFDVLA